MTLVSPRLHLGTVSCSFATCNFEYGRYRANHFSVLGIVSCSFAPRNLVHGRRAQANPNRCMWQHGRMPCFLPKPVWVVHGFCATAAPGLIADEPNTHGLPRRGTTAFCKSTTCYLSFAASVALFSRPSFFHPLFSHSSPVSPASCDQWCWRETTMLNQRKRAAPGHACREDALCFLGALCASWAFTRLGRACFRPLPNWACLPAPWRLNHSCSHRLVDYNNCRCRTTGSRLHRSYSSSEKALNSQDFEHSHFPSQMREVKPDPPPNVSNTYQQHPFQGSPPPIPLIKRVGLSWGFRIWSELGLLSGPQLWHAMVTQLSLFWWHPSCTCCLLAWPKWVCNGFTSQGLADDVGRRQRFDGVGLHLRSKKQQSPTR